MKRIIYIITVFIAVSCQQKEPSKTSIKVEAKKTLNNDSIESELKRKTFSEKPRIFSMDSLQKDGIKILKIDSISIKPLVYIHYQYNFKKKYSNDYGFGLIFLKNDTILLDQRHKGDNWFLSRSIELVDLNNDNIDDLLYKYGDESLVATSIYVGKKNKFQKIYNNPSSTVILDINKNGNAEIIHEIDVQKFGLDRGVHYDFSDSILTVVNEKNQYKIGKFKNLSSSYGYLDSFLFKVKYLEVQGDSLVDLSTSFPEEYQLRMNMHDYLTTEVLLFPTPNNWIEDVLVYNKKLASQK